ncbi:tyrosine-protein kinase Etk/Wzc [Shimia gijangensis]|uniref:Tyrosine-protein kinase Etk/Wzc n=1 Tax=Shimia gijangensis TaxID=1470563 RepID=A0A1M6TMI9_9RHOB|nr:polysaccharide biosynthesis tyrosine autokinase [Shimia gijangensis]SHK58154.1 tyrosine-protein kinase Etk/Wzc [Shimia gijangensis]
MNSSPSNSNSQFDEEIDLGQLFLNLWQGKWTILFVTFLVGTLSVFWALNTAPTYQADALLQLEEKAGANPFSGTFEGFGSDPASVTEIELLKSRLILGQAVAEQNLDWVAIPRQTPLIGYFVSEFGGLVELPEFMKPFAQSGETISLRFLRVPPHLLGTPLSLTKISETDFSLKIPEGPTLSGKLNQQLIDENTGIAIELSKLEGQVGREFTVVQESEEEAIKSVREKIGISEKGRNSGVLNVTFKDGNKEDASRALNAIVSAYLRQNISRNSAEAENSLKFIEDRLPEVRSIVDRAEEKLKDLQSERNTLDLSFETQALLEQRNQVEAELAALEIEEQELQRKYTVSHPNYKMLLSRKEQLETRLKALEARSLDLPDTQREIFDMTQELELARETYSKLLIRAQELRVVKASTIGNARVIDHAQTASLPIAPRKAVIVALGALLGLMLGVAIVLLKNFRSKGIKSSAEIEALGLSVFAVVNAVKPGLLKPRKSGGKNPILAIDDPTDLAVEALRGLRTSLHFGMLEKDAKVLSITSPSPNAGKSFCSTNLAIVSAQAGQKVCLIDADLRRGELRKFFGVKKDTPGLAELLVGDKKSEDVVTSTSVNTLSFIPTGKFPPNPADLLMTPTFASTLDKLSEQFDLIILDCPPVLAVTDPVMISKQASMTLVVVRYGVTTEKEMHAMQREIDASSGTISGAIFNGFQRGKGEKYGGYDYRYEYK